MVAHSSEQEIEYFGIPDEERNVPDRELVLEIIKRLRESQQEAKTAESFGATHRADVWRARARAFDECYTELKGRGYAVKINRY